MQDNNKALIYGVITVLSWSTVATMFKIALAHYSYFEMLLVASFTALLFFAIVITAQRKWHLVRQLSVKQWSKIAFLGLLNPTMYYLVLFKAYDLLPAQVVQPINYSWPIVLLLLLALFARQPIAKSKYIGMFLSLFGVALISFGSGNTGQGNIAVVGLLLAFLSAFIWAGYWMMNRKSENLDSAVLLFSGFLTGFIYLLIGSLFVDVHLDSQAGFLSSVYIGLFEMGIPFVFFGLALQKTKNPTLINQMCYLSPFISLFLIHIVLKEEIYVTTYIGLILIVFGIVFNEYLTKYFVKQRN